MATSFVLDLPRHAGRRVPRRCLRFLILDVVWNEFSSRCTLVLSKGLDFFPDWRRSLTARETRGGRGCANAPLIATGHPYSQPQQVS